MRFAMLVAAALLLAGCGHGEPKPVGPQELAAQHDCPWPDAALVDVLYPGHVVIVQDGVAKYGGPAMVKLALDQDIGGHDHGFTRFAYCR
jgi:hypothetical protein